MAATGCSFFRRGRRERKTTALVTETESSKAALRQVTADTGFIYDPYMRVGLGAMSMENAGIGSGGDSVTGGYATSAAAAAGGSTLCSAVRRRNPIVVDVYVVDENLPDILPSYYTAPCGGGGGAAAHPPKAVLPS